MRHELTHLWAPVPRWSSRGRFLYNADGLFGFEHFAMVQLLDGAIVVWIQLHDRSQLIV